MVSNLKKAREGNNDQESNIAMHACLLTFDALTNDSSMREILRKCKVSEFEHLTEVVNACMSISLHKELSILIPSVEKSAEEVKFEERTSKFLKTYVR